jgi:hypothetical protein
MGNHDDEEKEAPDDRTLSAPERHPSFSSINNA